MDAIARSLSVSQRQYASASWNDTRLTGWFGDTAEAVRVREPELRVFDERAKLRDRDRIARDVVLGQVDDVLRLLVFSAETILPGSLPIVNGPASTLMNPSRSSSGSHHRSARKRGSPRRPRAEATSARSATGAAPVMASRSTRCKRWRLSARSVIPLPVSTCAASASTSSRPVSRRGGDRETRLQQVDRLLRLRKHAHQPPEQERQRVAPLGRRRAITEHVGQPCLVHVNRALGREELLERQVREAGAVSGRRDKQAALRQERLARLEGARPRPARCSP